MMLRQLRVLTRTLAWIAAALILLAILLSLVAIFGWLTRFNDSVTLPNGMILRREIDLAWTERDDMFASDGRTRLARNIEFVCFNDRYVRVTAFSGGEGGLYDGATGTKVPPERYDEVYPESGLGGHRVTCNGYYTGMLGPGLLYDGLEAPFLPACSWRNLDNPELASRQWFDRPCEQDR